MLSLVALYLVKPFSCGLKKAKYLMWDMTVSSWRMHVDRPNPIACCSHSLSCVLANDRFDPLFIEDPMNYSNNVGRNCFRVHQIQRAWSDAHASLTRALDDESHLRASPYRLLRCIISNPEPAPDG